MRLHDLLEGSHCGDLMTFETKGDRTLFFDLLPLAVRSQSGFTVKFKVFTVPGQVAHDATRKAVLSRADGVVFVADSQKSQSVSNFESFDNLEKNARRVGLDFDRLPLVVQFNKARSCGYCRGAGYPGPLETFRAAHCPGLGAQRCGRETHLPASARGDVRVS